MAKPLPQKYFPGCGIAKISLRKVDKWAEQWAKNGIQPYFDTWKEAHDYMLEKTRSEIKRLERHLASAKRHLAKVEKLKNPIVTNHSEMAEFTKSNA